MTQHLGNVSGSDDPPKSSRARGGRTDQVVGALFGVFATGFVLSPQSPLNDKMCNLLADSPAAAGWVCADESIKISEGSAAVFIDRWTGQLAGSRREVLTWRFLSRGVEVQEPPTDYVARWRPVVFASRVSAVQRDPDEFNVFTAKVQRLYYVDAIDAEDPPFDVDRIGIDDLTLRFDLSLDGKGRVTSLMPQVMNRDAHPGHKPLVSIQTAIDSDFYDDTERTPDSGQSFLAGSKARGVCGREVDGGWWTWTNVGWVPNEDLVGGNAPIPSLADCPAPPLS